MATPAQLAANAANCLLSCGPRTPEGKAASSGNSTRHGLSARSIDAEAIHPLFAARLAEWAAEVRPETAEAAEALRVAVAMTFRLDECAAAVGAASVRHRERAAGAWALDRRADVADLLARLPRRPEVVARKLEAGAHGVAALIELWGCLGASLEADGGAWDEAETATALDLLGYARHLRRGRLPIDPADPSADVRDHRRAFVRRQVDRLAELRARHLDGLDALDRVQAERGYTALASRPVQLLLRYEAAAERRFHRAMRAAKGKSAQQGSPESVGFDPGPVLRDEPADPFAAPEVPSMGLDELADVPHRFAALLARDEDPSEPDEPEPPPALAATSRRPDAGRRLNRHQRRAHAARERSGR